MKCATCMWFVEKTGPASVQQAGFEVIRFESTDDELSEMDTPKLRPATGDQLQHQLGRCRRHAPTMGGYPVVYADDWCGDHKIDENKI